MSPLFSGMTSNTFQFNGIEKLLFPKFVELWGSDVFSPQLRCNSVKRTFFFIPPNAK